MLLLFLICYCFSFQIWIWCYCSEIISKNFVFVFHIWIIVHSTCFVQFVDKHAGEIATQYSCHEFMDRFWIALFLRHNFVSFDSFYLFFEWWMQRRMLSYILSKVSSRSKLHITGNATLNIPLIFAASTMNFFFDRCRSHQSNLPHFPKNFR